MRRASLLLILFVGLLLRGLYLSQVAALPFFDQPIGDSAFYLSRASEILGGRFIPNRPFFYGSVLYPYYLAAVRALPGGSLYLAAFLQVLGGSALIYVLARTARRLYGRAAGLAAAALTALYGPFAFLEADILGAIWGLLAVGLGILWCVRWARGRPGAIRYPLLAGGALGFAAAERPNLLLLVPLTAIWIAWAERKAKNRGLVSGEEGRGGAVSFKPSLALLAGAAIAFSPVALLNRAAGGAWTLLNTSRGINLYVGNNPRADGTYDEPWSGDDPQFTARYTDLEESSRLMAARLTGRKSTQGEMTQEGASSFWSRRAIAFITREPGAFAVLTMRKAALLWNAAEIPNHLDFAFMRGVAPALRWMPVGFGTVAPLAAAGVVLSLLRARRRRETILLVVLTCGAALSVLPFFVADRYRAPMVPPLIVAAACGAVGLARALARRGERSDWRVGVALLPALALGVFSQVPLTHPDLSRDHWLLAQAYRARGELAKARIEYEAALAEAGENGVLLNNLGRVYRAMGAEAEAESAFRRAIKAAPALAFPRKNLGLLLIGLGRKDEATTELEEAVRLDAGDAEAFGAIASIRAEIGEREEAASAYAKARHLDPSDPRLARLLELYPYLAAGTVTSLPARP